MATLLPPEKRLAEIFGVSVGTVQAALQQLQQRGEIVRRSGYGSRVVLGDSFSSAVWHFRIIDRDSGRRLALVAERIDIDEIARADLDGAAAAVDPLVPVWSAFLGEDDSYICIRRVLTQSNGANVAARMILRSRTAARPAQNRAGGIIRGQYPQLPSGRVRRRDRPSQHGNPLCRQRRRR